MDASAFSNVLECPICLDIFKEPLVLNNCGHSVCSNCVKKLIEAPPTRRSVVCPECRTASEVPADGFKKNYRLADIITKLEDSRGRGRDSLNQARPSTVPVDPTKFVGKWRFVTSENLDEYAKELGVDIMTRKEIGSVEAQNTVNPVLLDIGVNGEHWKCTTTLASITDVKEFDLDKATEVTTLSGRKKTHAYHFVGGKLILESKKIDPGDMNWKTEWHLEDGMLVLTKETETGVTAKVFYERI